MPTAFGSFSRSRIRALLAAPVWVTAELLAQVTKGAAISRQLTATSGAASITYTKVSAQTWVAVSSSGLLTGTGTWTGTTDTTDTSNSNFIVVEVRDNLNQVTSRTFTLPVTSTLPAFSTYRNNGLTPNSSVGSRVYAYESNYVDFIFSTDSSIIGYVAYTLPFGSLSNIGGNTARLSGSAGGPGNYTVYFLVRDSEYQILYYSSTVSVVTATYNNYYTIGTIPYYTYTVQRSRTAYRTVYTYQTYQRYYNYYLTIITILL